MWIVGGEVLRPRHDDPRLHPSSAVGVEPGVDSLHPQLLERTQVVHGHSHYAKGLHHAQADRSLNLHYC